MRILSKDFLGIAYFILSYIIVFVNSIDLKILASFDLDPSPKTLPDSYMDSYEKNIEKFNYLKQHQIEDELENYSRKIYKNFKDSFIKAYSDRLEELSLVQIPEWKLILNEKIFRYKKSHGNLIRKYGYEKNCNLNDFKLKKYQKISICPWHHILVVRKDRYPYMRVNSECNCENCLFKNDQQESKIYKFECQQEFTLMPALEKVDFVFGHYNESRWIFGMEEVATSCVCMRKLV